jgi:2-amino-4-hydroxy-6-hydroxymethyldihydropteridine diphosphokinase
MDAELVIAYLCLGSNLGDRRENINKALDYLSQKLRVTMKSSVYDTEPMGNPEQPRFLNMVCEVKTMLKAADLLVLVKAIEWKLGRRPGRPNSPRTIDLDILFFGDQVIESPELIIPHPRLTKRAFVLVPLAELVPKMVHPLNKKTVCELLKELKQGVQGVLKLE